MAKNKIETKTVTTFMKISRVPIAGEMIGLSKKASLQLGGAKYVRVTSIIHTDLAEEGQDAIVKVEIV
jgi:hypothetical protein